MYPDANLNLSKQTDSAVYFFSHGLDPLNNWSAHAVKIWGKVFPTVEHGFHYRKFSETAPEVAVEVLGAPSPLAAMQVARSHRELVRKDWHEVKVEIMSDLIRAKVEQNMEVKNCLLATADKEIIENSPWDTFWGIGEDGKGQNQMGKIWMLIRGEQDS